MYSGLIGVFLSSNRHSVIRLIPTSSRTFLPYFSTTYLRILYLASSLSLETSTFSHQELCSAKIITADVSVYSKKLKRREKLIRIILEPMVGFISVAGPRGIEPGTTGFGGWHLNTSVPRFDEDPGQIR